MKVKEMKGVGGKKDDNKTHGNLLNHILIFLLSIVIVATNFLHLNFLYVYSTRIIARKRSLVLLKKNSNLGDWKMFFKYFSVSFLQK